VVREGVVAGVVGLAGGLAIAVVAGGRLEPLLFETSPRSPAVLAVVTITLLAAAALASVLPAWRATRIEPAMALRVE
jgi:ABC-type antimicrobial peptide transport system permease subunit